MEHGDELSCSRAVKSCTESYARLVANAVCVEVAWRCQFLDALSEVSKTGTFLWAANIKLLTFLVIEPCS